MTWPTYQLDELGSVNRGRSRHRPRNAPHLYGGPYPFVQTSDVKNAKLYLTSFDQTYSAAGLAQSKLWDEGTLCITIAANIAETTILGIKACFPDSIIGFIADPTKSDVRFIKYYFNHYQRQFQQISQGATQDNLSAEKLLSIKIPVPALPTQKKIAGVLSVYDDLIEANLKRIKLLEEMAQITYEEWFVRLHFPNHETTPINPETGLPEGWVKAKFKSLMTLNYGKSLTAENRVDGNIPVYGSSGIVGFHNQALVSGSGLILGRKGNVGSVFFSEVPFYAIDTVYFITSKIPLRFLYYVLTSAHFINNDAAVPGLNRDAAYAKETILPPPEAIDRFNQFLTPHFQLAEKLRLQNTLLKEARDLLLPRLMTGLIDIDDYLSRNGSAAVAA